MYNKETNMYEGYIYKIDGPEDLSYVGQTSLTIQQRWNAHKTETRKSCDKMYIHNAMRKYGFDAFHIYEINSYKAKTKEELKSILDNWQIFYISYYNTLVPNGYNLTKGGDSASELNSDSVVAFLPDGTFYGEWDSITEASRQTGKDRWLIAKSCKGIIGETSGLIWRYKGQDFLAHTIEKPVISGTSNRQVDQFDDDWNLLKTFDTLREAAIEVNNGCADSSAIIRCCNGKKQHAYGYRWKYHDPDEHSSWAKKKHGTTKMNQYTKDEKFIKTFNSAREAAEAIGSKSTSGIMYSCKSDHLLAKGFRFYRADDPNQPDKTKIIED